MVENTRWGRIGYSIVGKEDSVELREKIMVDRTGVGVRMGSKYCLDR